jgi:hypothetical protein
MTIPTSSARNDYDGTDITGPYPITWKFFENADLLVTVDGVVKTLTTDYTVTGAGEQAGGALTFTAAISNGAKISIEPRGAFDQETDIRNEGGNLRVAIEDRFDRLCRDDQVVKGLVDRSLKVRTNEASTFDPSIPEPIANYALAISASGNGIKLVAPGVATVVGDGTDVSNAEVLADGSVVSRTLAETLSNIGTFPIGVGTEDRANQHTYDPETSALRCGASDTTPQNDERGFWSGLSSQNSWGNSGNIGLFSAAFNRNGCSYGTYSTTFGHDCIAYGVAAGAGGAGSCAGDPSAPASPAFEGYCSLAWGKNVMASGAKSAALCEETKAQARASLAAGYASETAGQGGDTGTGSIALGYLAKANGNGAVAIGRDVVANASPYTLTAVQIGSGGTGYTASDTLTVSGGTGTSATIRVDTVSGGVITGITILVYGSYSVKPTSPNSVTGGTGSNASIILYWVEGGIAIGRGANAGSPMVVGSGRMGFGVNTIVPTMEFLPAINPSSDYGEAILRGTTYFKGSVVTTGDDKTIGAIVPEATNTGSGGSGGLHLKAMVAGTLTNGWLVDAGNVSGGVCLYPHTDDATRLGAAARRPSVLYAVTGTINTSDEREKQDIEDIPSAWLDAWSEVQFQRFRWKSAVATKGDGARWHVGVVAQRVKQVFADRGLDALAIGILCHDTWTEPSGEQRDRYGVRYEEALILECAMLRRRLEQLEA